jgi:hypothetical protein
MNVSLFITSVRCTCKKLCVSSQKFSLPSRTSKYLSTCRMATKSALVLLAEGAEEMELVISVDVLRRAGVSYFHVNTILMSFFIIGIVLVFLWSQSCLF